MYQPLHGSTGWSSRQAGGEFRIWSSDQLTRSRALHHCSICLSPFFSTGQGHYRCHYPAPTLTHFLCHVYCTRTENSSAAANFLPNQHPPSVSLTKVKPGHHRCQAVFLSVWDGTERKVSSHTVRFFPVFTADNELTAVQLLKDVPHITPCYK